ncbi:MAG: thiamine biosynthesis protein ApbE [Flavobacteriaceae bacterium]|nr:thiamine biosynthesis protein ApbE [Flavobacteriaceae bacterium]|tara:strand:+ start:628 stop:1659 length:1032 start_codon:yes stop_codon:yes gene_type:complete
MRSLGSIFILILIVWSCTSEAPQKTILQGEAFGTTYTIQYFSQEPSELKSGIDSVIQAINQSLSTYLPSSDISKINAGDSTVQTDLAFQEVYTLSESIYQQSNGYFDPTIGVLRNAYGFGNERPLQQIDSTVLDSLMNYVGFSKVQLRSNGTISKEHPAIYFDFNAVAKGYGIDRIGAYLSEQNIQHYLIELGGELLASGTNIEKQQAWIVGIEAVDSDLDARSYAATVQLKGKGMASSGNYRKFRLDSLTGKKYVHTINPLTGAAEQSDVTSATVIANTCAEADAYATAFMAMGLERSKEMLRKLPSVGAYLTYVDANGNSQIFVSEVFRPELLEEFSSDRK